MPSRCFKIEAAEELILNHTLIFYADITEVKIRFSNTLMTFQNSKKVIIDNITLALIVNTCIENVIHISNTSEVTLYNIKVEELESRAIPDKLISIDDLFELTNLINLTIKYVQLNITAGIDNQIFHLRNVQMTEIQHLSFNECIFRSPNRNSPYLFTYTSNEGFKGNGSISQNMFTMDFVRIYTAVFLEVGLLNLNSANFATEKLFFNVFFDSREFKCTNDQICDF